MLKQKNIIMEKAASFSSSISGALSFFGGYQVCHNVCLWIIALLSLIGITIVGMPLLFLQTVAIPFWIAAVFLFIITLIFYFKKKCISKNLLMFNSGIIIAGIPFKAVQNYSMILWVIGGTLVVLSFLFYTKEKIRKNKMNKIKNFIEKNKKYSTDIVRIAVSLVFLWFGISQLVNPESFLGYIPQWLHPHEPQMQHEHPLQFMHGIPNVKANTIIMSNGVFESIFGFLLLAGFFTRIAAFLLALHLFGISFSLGYNDVAVRDFGLALATASLIFSGAGELSLDNKLRKKKLG